MRPYYAEYANHILRFYTRHADNGSDNWKAADKVFKQLTAREQTEILSVYRDNKAISDYQIVHKVIKKIANERGLL